MRLYHVSPSANDVSIRTQGLLLAACRDARRLIWAVRRDMLDWAIAHVRVRHITSRVTVWVLDVPASWTRRAPHGPLMIGRDVPPGRIKGTLQVLNGVTLL